MSKRAREQAQVRRHLAQVRRQQRAAQWRKRLLLGVPAVIAVAAGLAAVIIWATGGTTASPGARTGANGPFLAGLASMAQGGTVDAIRCDSSEQSVYHIHAHLAVFASGTARPVPAGIGIPGATPASADQGRCVYWLHTHDQSGDIHIESPVRKLFTLGDFFDVWGQPLSSTRAGTASGLVTIYVNGSRFTGNPRAIVLRPHAIIQLDVGTAVPPRPYAFASGL